MNTDEPLQGDVCFTPNSGRVPSLL